MTITSDDLYQAEQEGHISLELSAHVKGTIRVLKEESAHYQARLTQARALIRALTFGGQMSPALMPPDTRRLWEAWEKEERRIK